MDERRFDDLVRNLGATGQSRRAILKGLMAGAISGAIGMLSVGDAVAGSNGKGNGNGNSSKPDCCPASAPRLCDNHCVDFLSDASNCGTCGNSCPNGATCQNGACLCPTGTTLCGNVCVDTTGDPQNCGACGHACAAGDLCQAGHCITPTECTPSTTRSCYSGPANTMGVGICTAGTQTCRADGTWGVCVGEVLPTTETCNGLDDDCDGVPDNGFDLQHDVNNCGTCGHVCIAVNGIAGCNFGQCVVVQCNPGFADCDGNAANGCETSVTTDNQNCGACGNSCGSGGICINGVCTSNCPAGTICLPITYNPTTGQCQQFPATAGSPCGNNQVCDGAGSCVNQP